MPREATLPFLSLLKLNQREWIRSVVTWPKAARVLIAPKSANACLVGNRPMAENKSVGIIKDGHPRHQFNIVRGAAPDFHSPSRCAALR